MEFLAWDSLELERRYALEPADGETPESLFERRWAHAVVATALESLATEMASDGTADRFAALKRFLQGGEAPGAYAAAGAHLGLSEAATKSAIFRMRRRYGELIRARVAQTVATPAEAKAEIRHLLSSLGGR